MASNVVVLHNNQRYVIKTTPSMLCREILIKACEKIGLKNVENYGLKNGKNAVDLALPVRLANLAAGAKLDIFRVTAAEASKPIALALQCTDPSIRLTGTFPPTATLTEILLHFEQESNGALVVFGRKGEEAVVSILGREFAITEGPGPTLAATGVSGNVLVRLDFRKPGLSRAAASGALSSVPRTARPVHSPQKSVPPTLTSISQTEPQIVQPNPPTLPVRPPEAEVPAPAPQYDQPQPSLTPPAPDTPRTPPQIGPSNRNRIVYTAASSHTPTAAKLEHDESAYEMTTEQAKGYQAHLSSHVKAYADRTLMTREMREAAEREKAEKRIFKTCDVRIRFPDGTQIQGTFGADETVGDIYTFVEEHLAKVEIRFQLHLLPKGELGDLSAKIKNSGFAARTLLVFTWNAPREERILRDEVLRDAVAIEGVARGLLGDEPRSKAKSSEKSNESTGTSAGSKLPKWLNKLSKK